MEIENMSCFDMSTLLRQDDLCVRKFALSSPSVTVEEYFQKLSEFLLLAPHVMSALRKFSDREGDKTAYKSIDSVITLLTSVGCDKLAVAFHPVLDTYGKAGNWREAAAHAKLIQDDFAGFHQSIEAARTNKKPDALPDAALTLNEFIRRLDDEEANRKLVILAVDDSPAILNAISFSLNNNEYKVFTLVKPTEMERVLQKLTPDLFLLDYKMPEINGFDLVPIIRAFEYHKDTPIIFLTSEGTVDTVTAAIALGACDFIVKPFQPDVLREKIARHIVRKKAS